MTSQTVIQLSMIAAMLACMLALVVGLEWRDRVRIRRGELAPREDERHGERPSRRPGPPYPDTHAIARRLAAGGFDDAQVEALMDVVRMLAGMPMAGDGPGDTRSRQHDTDPTVALVPTAVALAAADGSVDSGGRGAGSSASSSTSDATTSASAGTSSDGGASSM